MMYHVELTEKAEEDMLFWCKQDKKTLKRIRSLIADIQKTPYVGIGKPEALRFEWSGYYSRRIDLKNRIIYSVDEQSKTVFIVMMKNHY